MKALVSLFAILVGFVGLFGTPRVFGDSLPAVGELVHDYAEAMNEPKPFIIRKGQAFKDHQTQLRRKVLECIGLWPLPERVPLDVHTSETLDHSWCTVRRIYYQLWPNVYSSGLLYMPKNLPEKPAAAMLCPHGHWARGNANRTPQSRCLVLAKKGFVVFSTTQNHHEELNVGVSNQTLMVWNNMRGLDYLQSLPEVDKNRIGCAGGSGGAMQTLMLVGLDDRVKAATIAGWGADFNRLLYPAGHHCYCHQFPNVMRYTDHPEISALGLTSAVQYLTMDDTTRFFDRDNFPTIQKLYEANGVGERADCKYWSMDHGFHQPLRERTYWWMERWLRGRTLAEPEPEPADVHRSECFPPKTLLALTAEVPRDIGFGHIGVLYRTSRCYEAPTISNRADWQSYRERMVASLAHLLGEEAALPRTENTVKVVSNEVQDGVVREEVHFSTEGGFVLPTMLLRRDGSAGKLPVVVICSAGDRTKLLASTDPNSPVELARNGALVVLPDVRFFGKLAIDDGLRGTLERSALTWGRPFLGMAATDIRSVVDGLVARDDADKLRVRVVSADSSALAIAVVFAAALDNRISDVDVDMKNCDFDRRSLPTLPFVLHHGDVHQWAALLADRSLTARNVGDAAWLKGVFAAAGNSSGLRVETN